MNMLLEKTDHIAVQPDTDAEKKVIRDLLQAALRGL